MIARYLRPGFEFALAHAIEEAGEFLAAAGKTLRWGRTSVNPELPTDQQESNEDWLRREMRDLDGAIARLGVAMSLPSDVHSSGPTHWSTEVCSLDAERIRIGIMLTLDPGPMREFRSFLDVDLDEAHATELLCKLGVALQQLRERRGITAEQQWQ